MRALPACLIALFALVTLAAGPVVAADFWPMVDGAAFHYRNAAGAACDVTIHAFVFNGTVRCERGWSGVDAACSYSETFHVDADGDVLCDVSFSYCESWVDPDWRTFTPPLLFLDLPLTVGKSWSCTTRPGGVWLFQVTGEQVVTVPAGTFPVSILSVFAMLSDETQLEGTWYLNRDLGPVILPGGYELVSRSGLVADTPSSWGAVKALYR